MQAAALPCSISKWWYRTSISSMHTIIITLAASSPKTANQLGVPSRTSTTRSPTTPNLSNYSKIDVWHRFIGRIHKTRIRWVCKSQPTIDNFPQVNQPAITSNIPHINSLPISCPMQALVSCQRIKSGSVKIRSSTNLAIKSRPILPYTRKPY